MRARTPPLSSDFHHSLHLCCDRSFQTMHAGCPNLRQVFVCGSPYALVSGPEVKAWDRFQRDLFELNGFRTKLRHVSLCPPSPWAVLATSRLLQVCRAMVLNDASLQANAWLLTMSVLGEGYVALCVSECCAVPKPLTCLFCVLRRCNSDTGGFQSGYGTFFGFFCELYLWRV